MKKLILLMCLVFAPSLHAQMSDLYVGSGVAYDYYGKSGFAALTTLGVKINGNIYALGNIELTKEIANFSGGGAYTIFTSKNFSLVALADAGATTGTGSILTSLSGGGFIAYNVGKIATKGKEDFYIAFGAKIKNIASLGNQPVFGIGFYKGFNKQ